MQIKKGNQAKDGEILIVLSVVQEGEKQREPSNIDQGRVLAVSLFWTAEIKLKWTDKSVSPSVSP